MNEKRFARFDWIILNPLWVIFIVLACFYCFHQAWLVGISMIGINLLIGVVGASLHKNRSVRELTAGYPKPEDAFGRECEEITGNESTFVIARAAMGIGVIIGIAAMILLKHHGIRLLWAVILGAVGAWLGMCMIIMVFGISEWFSRRSR